MRLGPHRWIISAEWVSNAYDTFISCRQLLVAVLEYIGPPVLYGINFTAAKYRAAKIKYFFCLFSQSVNQSVDPSICPCICQLFSLVMHSRTRKCKCCFLSACRIILMVVVKSTVSVASLLERGTIYPLSWSCCAGGRKFESWLMGV